MKFSIHILTLIIIFLPLYAESSERYTPTIADPLLEPWRWRHEEVLNGLSVICMAEAKDGSLWFGNAGSIAHYDGIKVTEIPFENPLIEGHTPHSRILLAKAITVLPSGDPLVLIGQTLVLRKNDQWEVIIEDVGRCTLVAHLKQAPDGTIWLLVPGKLWHISKDLREVSEEMKASSNGFLGSFSFDQAGKLWLCEKTDSTHARLVQRSADGTFSSPESAWIPFKTRAREMQIAIGDDGLIWYADSHEETPLLTFDPSRDKWSNIDTPDKRFLSLTKGLDGSIWAGGTKTILRAPPGKKPIYYPSDQIQFPQVPITLLETKRRLWFIGRIGYTHSVDISNTEWMTYENLKFQCETADGKQWFVLKRSLGVILHDPHSGTWTKYEKSDGLIDTVQVIISSSHGLTWVAGSNEGTAAISVFDGQTWTRDVHPELGATIEPRAVMEALDGSVWFGAGYPHPNNPMNSGGALQYGVDEDGQPYLIKHHAPPRFPEYVAVITQSKDHTFHIGSIDYYQYHASSENAPLRAELLGLSVVDIVMDRDQNLWLAKDHGGVYQQQPDASWKRHSPRDGIAGLTLSDLLFLRDGTLLAASGEGISRYDGLTWTTHAYPKSWGMASRWSGMHETSDGAVWFNLTPGEALSARAVVNKIKRQYTIRYQPEKTPPNTTIDPHQKRVAQRGTTHISWTAHDPWSSTNEEDLQYSWRLDQGSWSAFSLKTDRSFINLSSGHHTFEVRARDRAFNIDPTPDHITFEVIPPIWKQFWFIALISVLIGLIVWLIWLIMRNREKYLLNQQKEREAVLLNQQKEREEYLQEIDRIKTGFFTNISHELRTPLTVISGRLESMKKEETDESKKTGLSIVLRNAKRLATLVSQLLDVRKIEEGQLAVHQTWGDVVPLVQDCVASLQSVAEKSQITCTLNSVENCHGLFDFDKLQKIFTNLLSNAVKYTEADGHVCVELAVNKDDPENEQLIFMVEDDGLGIDPEHLESIFVRFYRVSEESNSMGNGIGLNLAKELVDLLSGHIEVKSPIHDNSERPGTRFTVTLPIKQGIADENTEQKKRLHSAIEASPAEMEQPEPAVILPSTKQPEETAQILIVEDDEDIRDFLFEGLQSNYQLDWAPNGENGLSKAKELIPDLIITDLMMPQMDGVEMCRILKTSLETSHIPVIMLTARASVENQMQGLMTGADDYIIKPFHMDLLKARIMNLLESRRLLREKFAQEQLLPTINLPANNPEKEFLKKMITVLEEHGFDSTFNPAKLAQELNMSLRSLQRKIKAVTNRGTSEFIYEFRMSCAAQMLIETNDPIAEISYNVGVDEPTNFSRRFKLCYKMTPSEYRAKHQSD